MTELEDLIELYSEYKVGSATTDNITSTQLTLLESSTASQLSRLNPGLSGTELSVFKMYLILDVWETKSEDSEIASEQIGDHRWTFSKSKTSSRWMDKALSMIATYKPEFGGVERSDSRMSSMATDQIRPEEYGMVDEPY